MKETFVQHKLITIPATIGTTTNSFLFKADDCYPYLSGIAAIFNGATTPVAADIQFELRSDYESILSFSPSENWLKNPSSNSFNLQDVFKPLRIEAKGRNFYFDVKVTNCEQFSFVVLLKQTLNPIDCIRYDEQSFSIKAPALGQGFSITLPSDYNRVKGVMLSGGQSENLCFLGFEIYDSFGQIVDPLPMAILTPSVNTPYDNGFFPLDFDSKAKQINVRLTALGELATPYVATDYIVTFLLTDRNV